MRFVLTALLVGASLNGCIIYEKDVYRHHDDEDWGYGGGGQTDDPKDNPNSGNNGGSGTGGTGGGEGEGEGEGEGDTGQTDTGQTDTGTPDTGSGGEGEGEGEGEADVVWTFWPNEIAPGQTLLSTLTTYPTTDYFNVVDVGLYGDLEVCSFTTTSAGIYVSIAASVDALAGPNDALIVLADGTTTWVTDAITVAGDPIVSEDTGATTGCE